MRGGRLPKSNVSAAMGVNGMEVVFMISAAGDWD